MKEAAVNNGSEWTEHKDAVMQDGVMTDVAVRGVTIDAVV